jgi:hypothetical protein
MKVIDRIDLSHKGKTIVIINKIAVAYVGAWVLGIVFLKDSLGDIGFDDLKTLIIPLLIYLNVMRFYGVEKDLFIEWRETELEYKSHLKSGCVDVQMIDRIDVGSDDVVIKLKNGEIRNINISRFTKYEDRLRLKRNFSAAQGLLDYKFWLEMVILTLGVRGIQYLQVNDKSLIINNTAFEVSLRENEIVIETYSFELFSWPDRPWKTLRFELNGLYIRQLKYPLNPFINIDSRAFRLSDGDRLEAYIVIDSFDQELHNKLDKILNSPSVNS